MESNRKKRVQIEVPRFLMHITKGVDSIDVRGNNVGECVSNFIEDFPLTRNFLLNRDGELIGYVELFLNGVSTFPEELNTPVNDGDTISMYYIIDGG